MSLPLRDRIVHRYIVCLNNAWTMFICHCRVSEMSIFLDYQYHCYQYYCYHYRSKLIDFIWFIFSRCVDGWWIRRVTTAIHPVKPTKRANCVGHQEWIEKENLTSLSDQRDTVDHNIFLRFSLRKSSHSSIGL